MENKWAIKTICNYVKLYGFPFYVGFKPSWGGGGGARFLDLSGGVLSHNENWSLRKLINANIRRALIIKEKTVLIKKCGVAI